MNSSYVVSFAGMMSHWRTIASLWGCQTPLTLVLDMLTPIHTHINHVFRWLANVTGISGKRQPLLLFSLTGIYLSNVHAPWSPRFLFPLGPGVRFHWRVCKQQSWAGCAYSTVLKPLHVPSTCAVQSAGLLTHILCKTQRETRRHGRHAHGRGRALRDSCGANFKIHCDMCAARKTDAASVYCTY